MHLCAAQIILSKPHELACSPLLHVQLHGPACSSCSHFLAPWAFFHTHTPLLHSSTCSARSYYTHHELRAGPFAFTNPCTCVLLKLFFPSPMSLRSVLFYIYSCMALRAAHVLISWPTGLSRTHTLLYSSTCSALSYSTHHELRAGIFTFTNPSACSSISHLTNHELARRPLSR